MDSQTTATTPARVIPLLSELSSVEEKISSLVMRLDPITNHVPQNDQSPLSTTSVTGRLHSLGDALQYLLDNIEL